MTNLAPTGAGATSQTAGLSSPSPYAALGVGQDPAAQTGAAGASPAGAGFQLPGTPTSPAVNGATAGAAATAGQNPAAAIGGIMKWMGPLGVIGGAAMAAYGFKAGSTAKTALGAIGALGSLWMTMNASKAEGAQQGITQGFTAGYSQGQTETVAVAQNQLSQQAAQFEQILEQVKAQYASQSGGSQLPGMPEPGGTGQSGNGQGQAPGTTGQGQGTGLGQTTGQTPGQTTGQTTPTTGAPITNWTSQSVLGRSVQLAAGQYGADVVADAGGFALKQILGDPNGYATQTEADAIARAAVSDVWNTKNTRWVVLEHGGRYYAYSAEADTSGGMAGTVQPLPADAGNVVGWHSLKMLLSGWISYHWANGQGTGEPWTGPVSAAQGSGPATAAPTTPVSGAVPTTTPAPGVAAGGPAQSGAAQQLVGSGFTMTSSSGSAQIQAQRVVGSATGYATADEAAQAIMDDRQAAPGGQFERWITVRGADGRFCALRGSVVSEAVTPFSGGASPMYVFGQSFGAWWDGTGWKAQAA